ncbi:hypothetical protein AYI68_g6525 [Smittium mucronatum]|uniref:Uncharacterized protein n=1 Tax=Smittium mucronatum TaxID=133383 RepID=A0A1R0GRD4_9FUNG|nr:hypothetical protein AYI68_g6525 [Smittium mucronatum]
MKKRKKHIENTSTLTTISSSVVLLDTYLQKKGTFYQPKDPPGISSSRCMTEVRCSQELSSLSKNNSSLKLLSSYSEPTSNRINKIGPISRPGIDRHGFPKNSC